MEKKARERRKLFPGWSQYAMDCGEYCSNYWDEAELGTIFVGHLKDLIFFSLFFWNRLIR